MTFLLAKILFLLVAAAAFGALAAHWWLRRHFEDVTADYDRLQHDWLSWRRGFEEKLAQRQPVDLGAVLGKLDALGEGIRRLEALSRAAPPAAGETAPVRTAAAEPEPTIAVEPPEPEIRAGSRNLLSHAGYGEADDLKRMKGVKRVMEKMLHDIGVYYFWQIAEWTPADVQHADAQLHEFHGRIERDHWIEQAIRLAQSGNSAARPPTLQASDGQAAVSGGLPS